jgi:hypothetical protein
MKIHAISGISHEITNTIGPQNRGQKCVSSFFAAITFCLQQPWLTDIFVPVFFSSFSRELELSNEVLSSYNCLENHY